MKGPTEFVSRFSEIEDVKVTSSCMKPSNYILKIASNVSSQNEYDGSHGSCGPPLVVLLSHEGLCGQW